jgi:hypothetical protein
MRMLMLFTAFTVTAGCASLRLNEVRVTPNRCAIDRALAGTWRDRRLTQLGPAWVRFDFTCDCRFSTRAQLLFLRFTERGQYRVADGAIEFERESGRMTSPYRIEDGTLFVEEYPGEVTSYVSWMDGSHAPQCASR